MSRVVLFPQGLVLARNLQRLFVECDLSEGGSVIFSESQAHYLRSVLRLGVGDHVRVFNGLQGEFRVILAEVGKKRVAAVIQEHLRAQQEWAGLHLAFVPLRASRNAILIEKAVELGVSSLTPVISERCNTRDLKVDKTYAQIIEASEQCERLTLPTLNPVITLSDFLRLKTFDQVLVADERRTASPLLAFLLRPGYDVQKNALLVGPEGGFTDNEFHLMAQHNNLSFISLGPNILRAETAALSALACTQQALDYVSFTQASTRGDA